MDFEVPVPAGEKLKGTKTEENLHTALSGESQAYQRYRWFASRAREEGYIGIAQIFEETARNESEHAETWFKILGGAEETVRNLEVAAAGEHFEWDEMYREFAATAREEGFEDIALRFERVAAIERRHEERYLASRDRVANGCEFKIADGESGTVLWVCLACGQIWSGDSAPEHCPSCGNPQGYFTRYKE